MLLSDSRIRLRALEPEDLDYIFRWENDSNAWFDGVNNNPFSYFACREFIKHSSSDIYHDGSLRLVIEDYTNDSIVGCVDFLNLDVRQGRVELAMYIDPIFRRQGYGAATVRLACQYAFSFLNLRMLYVYIRTTNTPCMELFRHIGFTHTATLQNWVATLDGFSDVAIFQRFNHK